MCSWGRVFSYRIPNSLSTRSTFFLVSFGMSSLFEVLLCARFLPIFELKRRWVCHPCRLISSFLLRDVSTILCMHDLCANDYGEIMSSLIPFGELCMRSRSQCLKRHAYDYVPLFAKSWLFVFQIFCNRFAFGMYAFAWWMFVLFTSCSWTFQAANRSHHESLQVAYRTSVFFPRAVRISFGFWERLGNVLEGGRLAHCRSTKRDNAQSLPYVFHIAPVGYMFPVPIWGLEYVHSSHFMCEAPKSEPRDLAWCARPEASPVSYRGAVCRPVAIRRHHFHPVDLGKWYAEVVTRYNFADYRAIELKQSK